MSLVSLLFYLFAAVLVVSAVLVVAARNPLHSVFGLILAFCNGAWLFVLAGAGTLGAIVVITTLVTVGVLSIFAIRMFDVDREEFRQVVGQHWGFGALVGVVLLVELILLMVGTGTTSAPLPLSDAAGPLVGPSSTTALGDIFRPTELLFLGLAALVIVTAMVGAAVLTLSEGQSSEEDTEAEPAPPPDAKPAAEEEISELPDGRALPL